MNDEFRRFNEGDPLRVCSNPAREQLEADVEKFLANGGEIKKIPAAVSGWEGKKFDMGFKLNLGVEKGWVKRRH